MDIFVSEAEKMLSKTSADLIKADSELTVIAKAIHYPECWDTIAYPELIDAIKEMGCNPRDCTHKPIDR